MINLNIPHFIINNNFQKRQEKYSDILTMDILSDICERITGAREHTVEFRNQLNKGRLAILIFNNFTNYISLSETEIHGRNASVQSIPTALVQYQLDESINKNIYFYFLPCVGNFETDYFIFIYRLMKTANMIFFNENDFLANRITPFNSVEDIIATRNQNQRRNNNATYLTVNANSTFQVYGKTYGANKYETTLLCLALAKITFYPIELHQIGEGGLTQLPETSREAIIRTNKIQIFLSDVRLEREEFIHNNSLRSSRYIYNLLDKLGDKKCTFCDCEIPQIIQGAHILSVSDIKNMRHLTFEQQLEYATDGENGLWLCQNHHRLLDVHLLKISENGQIQYHSGVQYSTENYIKLITIKQELSSDILTYRFMKYLRERNSILQEIHFRNLK